MKRLIFPCGAYFPIQDGDQLLERAHRAKDGAYLIGTYPASTPFADEEWAERWKNKGHCSKCSDGQYRVSCLWGCPTSKRRKVERGFDEAGNLGEYVACHARLFESVDPQLDGWVFNDITPPALEKCPHCEEQRTYVLACKRAAKAGEEAPDRTRWEKCPQCQQHRELTLDTGLCATCQLVKVLEENRG